MYYSILKSKDLVDRIVGVHHDVIYMTVGVVLRHFCDSREVKVDEVKQESQLIREVNCWVYREI